MKKLKILFITALAFISMLSACSSLQLATPQTFDQKYMYAKTTESVILEAAHTSYVNKIIGQSTESYIVKSVQGIDIIIVEAKTISKTDISTATAKLNIALQLIDKLRIFMDDNGIFTKNIK